MSLIVTGKKLDDSVILKDAFFVVHGCYLQDYMTFDFPRQPMTRVVLVLLQYENAEMAAAGAEHVIRSISFGFEHVPTDTYSVEDAEAYLVANGVPYYSGWQFTSVTTYIPPQG